jgi:hypothetical protein
VCLAKVAAQFAGRLPSGSSPARFEVIGAIRQSGEFDRNSASPTGNGDVDMPNARFGRGVRGNLTALTGNRRTGDDRYLGMTCRSSNCASTARARGSRTVSTQRRTSSRNTSPAPPVRGKPTVTPTAQGTRTPSAICPWTPLHSALQRHKVTLGGKEKNGPLAREFAASGALSQVMAGGGRCWVRTNEG